MKIRNSAMKLLTFSAAAVMTLSGCARDISSDVYSESHVGETSATYSGVVVSARKITVQENEKLKENQMGMLGGGVAGGAIGHTMGKGKGKDVATVAGAIAGAIGGAFAEKALNTQEAMEYVVELKNGEMRTVVQGIEPRLGIGHEVFLMVSTQGRSRLRARQ
ncbi:MAG: outer membrane lipoprotein SlyB [Chlamydiales bacterium]|jgi:outer membrane lipoprotein SlyB